MKQLPVTPHSQPLPEHIPGVLMSVPIDLYPIYLERLKAKGLVITGADKRVFDPGVGKYIPAIVYVGPSVAAGQTDEILENDMNNGPAAISFTESEQP